MQIPQLAPGLGKGPKIGGGFHGGNARQFLRSFVGVAFAVVRGMQQAIDIIKQVFLADFLAGIGGLEMGQACVGDGIAALAVGLRSIGILEFFSLFLFWVFAGIQGECRCLACRFAFRFSADGSFDQLPTIRRTQRLVRQDLSSIWAVLPQSVGEHTSGIGPLFGNRTPVLVNISP